VSVICCCAFAIVSFQLSTHRLEGNVHAQTACPNCGAQCIYSDPSSGGCFVGNCLDGSLTCGFNDNCGAVEGCSRELAVQCPPISPNPSPTVAKPTPSDTCQNCGAQCIYSDATLGGCFVGNCLDGSVNCGFNLNCGSVTFCSRKLSVACPLPTIQPQNPQPTVPPSIGGRVFYADIAYNRFIGEYSVDVKAMPFGASEGTAFYSQNIQADEAWGLYAIYPSPNSQFVVAIPNPEWILTQPGASRASLIDIVNGSEMEILSDPTNCYYWSPDSKNVVFLNESNNTFEYLNIPSGERKTIGRIGLKELDYLCAGENIWLSDNQTIIYSKQDTLRSLHVGTLTESVLYQASLTQGEGYARVMTPSVNGKDNSIVFLAINDDSLTTPNIFTYNIGDSNAQRLTNISTTATEFNEFIDNSLINSPQRIPYSDLVVFVSTKAHGGILEGINIVDTRTRTIRSVVQASNVSSLTVSADGEHIGYTISGDGGYLLNILTGQSIRLTRSEVLVVP
jgi:hypothetical protein